MQSQKRKNAVVLSLVLGCMLLLSVLSISASRAKAASASLTTPKISAVSNEATGVKITWEAVTGAEAYRVFYRTSSDSGWSKITDTTSTSYTWTGAKSGTTYIFTVRCVSGDGQSYTSSYDSTGKSITYVAAPKISAVSNEATGVKITWGAVTGAELYRVFYRTSVGSSWSKVTDTTSTSYTWTGAKSGTTYIFTVRCLSADGQSYTSNYDSTGKSITCVAAPKISAVSNEATGVKITWGAVTGAEAYRVFYRTSSDSGWSKVTDTTSTSYTWTGAKSGTTYIFTVRCLSADGQSYTSSYDSAGQSITYVAAPKISAVSNEATGVKITWGAVTGAELYRVYYKIGNGSWTKFVDTTSTSYTWTGATSGTTYAFTVRCLNSTATSFTSSYDSTGTSITYVAAPKISAVSNEATGVKITWGAVTGAELYRVYYKTGSGSWTKIADTTSTSYTWTGAKSGTTYAFTVRCLNSAATSFTSSYDSTGTSIAYVAAPKLSAVSNEATGVKITWGAVTGAELYRVYYKTGSGSWTKIVDTTSTSYTWTGAASGTTYTFTVRCLNSAATVATSSYDSTGMSIKYIAAPKLSAVSSEATGVKITWGAVTGAELYRVYYKTGSGSWTKIADTTSTSYTWTGAKSGTTYTFTVRCLNSAATVATSSFDATGKTITYQSANGPAYYTIDLGNGKTTTVYGYYDTAMADAIISQLNTYRKSKGLSTLTKTDELTRASNIRAYEITYIMNHTRPNGGTCFTVSSKVYAENIAAGYASADAVMTAWKNSSGHNANMLNASYKTIGVSVFIAQASDVQGYRIYFVQNFGY